jgi:hypothetical protein
VELRLCVIALGRRTSDLLTEISNLPVMQERGRRVSSKNQEEGALKNAPLELRHPVEKDRTVSRRQGWKRQADDSLGGVSVVELSQTGVLLAVDGPPRACRRRPEVCVVLLRNLGES